MRGERMIKPQVAPYGSWRSPITSDIIASGTIRLEQVVLDGEIADITPSPFNAKTRVHEYGGGAFTVYNGKVIFSNFNDQRLYCQNPDGRPRPITPPGKLRYADVVVDRLRDRLICVCENHTIDGREPVNTLMSIDIHGSKRSHVLISGLRCGDEE